MPPGFHHSEETKEKMRKSHLGKKHSKEHKQNISKGGKGKRRDKSHMGRPKTDEQKRAQSERMKGRKHTKKTKRNIGRGVRGSAKWQAVVHSQEFRLNVIAGLRKRYPHYNFKVDKTPEICVKKERVYSMPKEQRDKISKKMKGKYTGAKHHLWQGGKSFEPYCSKFNGALKENVRKRFGNKCQLFGCGKTKKGNKGRELCVHHVFTEKMACCESKIEEMNVLRKRLPRKVARFGRSTFSTEEIKYIRMMIPLCMSCHAKIVYESNDLPYAKTKYRKYFTELILTNYNGQCY